MKLLIDNSLSQIVGLDASKFSEIKAILRYRVSGKPWRAASWRNPYRYLIDAKGVFPTGLLYLVEEWLVDKKYQHVRQDNRRKHVRLQSFSDAVLPHVLYPEQSEAVDALIAANGRGIIVAPTGVGKSLIIAEAIRRMNVPTLVVVPTLELKRQLTSMLRDIFPMMVGDFDKAVIAVENVDALPLRPPTIPYDFVIIDEFHHSAAKTYRSLNTKAWKNIYFRCGLTATPFRSNDNERLLLESILANVVYRIPYDAAVALGRIVPMEAYYIEVPRSKTEGYTWAEVYNDLIVNNTERNRTIADVLHNLASQKIPTLCLVKEIAHGEIIQNMCKTLAPFVNGRDVESRIKILEFNLGQTPALIGTTGILGEGVDTKRCEFVIVAGLGKSRNALMQQFGRAFRNFDGKTSAKIILFKDLSHKWIKAHFVAQCKVLKEEYGVIPAKLDL